MAEKKVNRIGGLFDKNGKRRQAGSIYDINGLSPTLDTSAGGYRQPLVALEGGRKMLIREATKQGYTIAKEGDSININYPSSKTRRGRVGKKIAHTLTTQCEQAVILPATSDKDKRIIEENLTVRKLTPREYARLQDFSDETFDKLVEISNSQLYKIFGNSITVAVPREAFLLQALICIPGFTEDHSCVNCENCVHAGGNKFYCDVKYKLIAEKGKQTAGYEENCHEWQLKEKIKAVLAIARTKDKKE